MSITLTNLILQSRQRADMEDSDFILDAEVTTYINASVAELHDLMIASYGNEYKVTAYTFSTVAGTATSALPSAFYKILGLDVQSGGDWHSLKQFNFNERNRTTDDVGAPSLRYRLIGDNIMFSPTPDAVYSMKLWYIPKATALSSGSDTLDDLNSFAEYVIVDVAIKMLMKEESDVSVLLAQKEALKRRIEIMAQNRDAGQSPSISDIYAEDNELSLWRS